MREAVAAVERGQLEAALEHMAAAEVPDPPLPPVPSGSQNNRSWSWRQPRFPPPPHVPYLARRPKGGGDPWGAGPRRRAPGPTPGPHRAAGDPMPRMPRDVASYSKLFSCLLGIMF